MSKFLEIGVLALGGLCLFAVSFLGFALSAGVPMRDVALVGPLFEKASGEDAPEETDTKPPPEIKTDGEIIESHLSLLSLWSLDDPYSPDELNAMVARIKSKEDDLERRLEEIREREKLAQDKSASLTRQHETLATIRSELEAYDAELRLRASELKRDEAAAAEREVASWKETAALFEEGDAGSLSQRLLQFEAGDAAKILRSLEPARARELLSALDEASWKTYAEAYTKAK